MTLNAKIMEERAEAHAEGKAEGKAEERRQNIKAAVKMMKQLGLPDSEIYKRILENFGISGELLTSYVNETDTK